MLVATEKAPRGAGEGVHSDEPIVVLGSLEVEVHYQDQSTKLTLTVAECDGPSLLGRDWLQCIRLDWSQVHSASTSNLEKMLDQKKTLFQPGLGTIKGYIRPQAM